MADDQDKPTPEMGGADDSTPEMGGNRTDIQAIPDDPTVLKVELAEARKAIKDRNFEAAKQRKRLEELEKAERDRQQANLSEVERYKVRLSEMEAEAGKLPDLEAERDRYKAALDAHVLSLRKALPKHLTELLDGRDPVDQLAWLARHGDEIMPKGGTTPPRLGTPNRGGSRAAPVHETETNTNRDREYVRYGRL